MQGKKIRLSDRMQAVADLVPKGSHVCDVGCDHGYVSIYLMQQGIAAHVLAMDVNKGPLERAFEHVQMAGLTAEITVRLSDGLSAYEMGEANCLILAGMGCRLMQDILTKYPDKTGDFSTLILQPQSEVPQFRQFLKEFGYCTVAEEMVYEDGKFYEVMRVIPADTAKEADFMDLKEFRQKTAAPEQLAFRYGAGLLLQRDPILRQFLHKEVQNTEKLLRTLGTVEVQNAGDASVCSEKSRRSLARIEELQKELSYLRMAEAFYTQ